MAKYQLTIAVWHSDTTSNQNLTSNIRLWKLKEALSDFARAGLAKPKSGITATPGDTPRAIFVAPEYVFAKPTGERWKTGHTYDDQRALEQADKEKIVWELVAMSKAYPDVLILPGSITWRKPVVRDLGHMKTSELTALKSYRNDQTVGKDKTSVRVDKAVDALESHGTKLDTIYPLYGGRAIRMNPISGHPSQNVVEKLDGLSLGQFDYIQQNTLYGFWNGMIVLKYAKEGDFHEVLNGQRTVSVPGVYKGPFQIGNISLGCEICLDHALEMRPKINNPGTKRPLLNVLISAKVETKVNAQFDSIRDGGFFVHSSSELAYCKVFQKRKNPNTLTDLNAPRVIMSKGGVGVWDVEYDVI